MFSRKFASPKISRYLRFLVIANVLLILISVVFFNPFFFSNANPAGKVQSTLVPMDTSITSDEAIAVVASSVPNTDDSDVAGAIAENAAKTEEIIAPNTDASSQAPSNNPLPASENSGIAPSNTMSTTQNGQPEIVIVATSVTAIHNQAVGEAPKVAENTQNAANPIVESGTTATNPVTQSGTSQDNLTIVPTATIPTVVPDPYLTVQNPSNGAEITADVVAELQKTGSAPVMIYLRDAQSLQALQSAASIAIMQDDLVAAFRAGAFQLENEFSETPILVGEISPEALTTLTTHPTVASVQLDYPTMLHGLDDANLELIGADKVQSGTGTLSPYNGDGIVVAVLDTGMDTVHPQLIDNVLMQSGDKIQHCTADDCPDGNHDTNGHGTHVSGIITDIAPNIKILPIRVFNRDGSGKTSYWTKALEWVLKNHALYGIDVVSMSLGTSSAYSAACDVDFNGAYDLVTKLVNAGIPVFASTGNNSNQDLVSSPSCLQPIIAVSSVYQPPMPTPGYDGDDFDAIYANCYPDEPTDISIPCYASTGYQTDLLAPGIANSTWLHYQDGGMKTLYGTSQSAPQAAAVAALMLQAKPNLLPIQIEQILESTGQKITDARSTQPGKTGSYIFPNKFSYPLINAEKAVEAALKVEFECRNVKNLDKSECDALVAFYSSATTGGAWVNSAGWLQELDPCTWYGIECTTDDKHITAIRLPSNGLTGTLSSQIAALSQLQVLDVSFNALGGEAPVEINRLVFPYLNEVNLSYNRFMFNNTRQEFVKLTENGVLDAMWDITQTLPPDNVGRIATNMTNFIIFWTPIKYQAGDGIYNVTCRNTANSSDVRTATTGKSGSTVVFNNVKDDTIYNCEIITQNNSPNDLDSVATNISVSTRPSDVRNQNVNFAVVSDTSAGDDASIGGGAFRGGFQGLFLGDYIDFTTDPDNVFSDSRAYIKLGNVDLLSKDAVVDVVELRNVCFYADNPGPPKTLYVYHSLADWEEANMGLGAARPGYNGTPYGESGFDWGGTGYDCINIPLNKAVMNNISNGLVLVSSGPAVMCAYDAGALCGNTIPFLYLEIATNTGPGAAENPTPTNNTVNQITNGLSLTWENPPDSEGDNIDFAVYFSSDKSLVETRDATTRVANNYTGNSWLIPYELAKGETYWWVVDTYDEFDASTPGTLWNFTTGICGVVTEISPADCEKIIEIYSVLEGDTWSTNTAWLKNNTPCSWYGVSCRGGGSDTYKTVVGLSLPNNNLNGSFEQVIGLLKQFYLLETLNLSNNPNLTGSLNADIKWLSWLQTLNLSGTGIHGKLPAELNLLTKLQTLDLHNTNIGFDVPSLASLSALRVLDLSETNIISLPPQIGNLLSLRTLKVNQTKITQPIPADLGDLTQLRVLDMSYAGFYGAIPVNLVQLINITTANLNYNALHIPTDAMLVNWLAAANAYDANTQTLAVTDFVFDPTQMPIDPKITEKNSLTFTWTPIPGMTNADLNTDYILQCAGDGAIGKYVDRVKLPKTATVGTATDLYQASNYWCKLLTRTHPGGKQKNTLTAETSIINKITAGTVKIGSPTSPEEIPSIPYTAVFDTLSLLWIRDYPNTPIPECLKNNTGDNGNGWRGSFQFTYGTGSTLKIKVEGSDGTTAGVAIFEGNDLAGAVETLCNKNAGATGTTAFNNPDQTALVDYQTKPGQKFIIMVVETSGNDGQITLSITDSTYRGCDRIGQAWQISCQVLNDLYYGTGGPNWHRAEHWMQTSDLCVWEGVVCDVARTKIIGLDLAFNNLIGRIPESLGNLVTLESLHLASNNLEGEIPASFLKLAALQSADLRHNRLSATQPELIAFLNIVAPDWELQTVPPTFFAKRIAPDRIELVVNSIADSYTPGHYQIYYRVLGELNWRWAYTRSKATSILYINELSSDQVYEFYAVTVSLKTHPLHTQLQSSDSPIIPVMTLTPPLCDPKKITGSLNDLGTVGTFRYNGQQECLYPVGLAIYEKNGPALSDQVLFNSATPTLKFLPNQAHTVTVTPPTCAYQADLFIGEVIRRFDGVYYDNGTTDRLLAFEHKNGDDYCNLPAGRILAVELFDITTGATIRELGYGDTLDLRQLPPKLNIRARVDDGGLGSVRFDDGTGFRPARNTPPYVYIGGQGRYWQPRPGVFTLQVMPHSLPDGRGRAGAGVLLRLNIINSTGAGNELPPDPNTYNDVPPVIAPVPTQTDFEAILTALRLMVRADGIVRWQVTGLPPGIELEEATGLLIGRPIAGSARPMPYQVTIRAIDSAGQNAAPVVFDWYIQPVPQCRLEDLTAIISKDGTIGTITGKNLVPCQRKVGLASYEKHDDNQNNHTLYDSENPDHIFMPGEPLVMTIEVPECLAQVNIFEGEAIQPVFGTQRYGTRLIGISQHPYSTNGYCSGRVTEIALQLPNNNSLRPVRNGDVIDIADIGTWNADLIAQTHPMTVGSVFFQYTADPLTAIANTVPYIFPSSQLQLGRFTLTATAYSGADGSGRAGVPHVVTFTVVNTNQTPQIVTLTNVALETGENVTVNLRDFIEDDNATLRCGIAAEGDASLLLPLGLSLDDDQCTITGIPQAAGDWFIPLRVVDPINPPVNFSLSVTVTTPVDAIAAPVAIEAPVMVITPEPETTVEPAATVVQPPSEATAEVTPESIIPQEVQLTDEPLPEATSEAANQ